MIVEIVYVAVNKEIDSMTVGVFPPRGRYFRMPMTRKEGLSFHVEVKLPPGKSYYHLFSDGMFNMPMADVPGLLSPNDHQKRIVINQNTDIFCPVAFLDNGKYYDFINDSFVELKVISLHNFITKICLVNENLERIEFDNVFEYKNKKYWILHVEQIVLGEKFLLEVQMNQDVKYFNSMNTFQDELDFSVGFKSKTNQQSPQQYLSSEVGYQIYPDSFKRGKTSNDVTYLKHWKSQPELYSYYGGDLIGIKEKLQYLKNLGVDFVYLNPIFQSRSPHRYDVVNYKQIDSILGTDDDFKELVSLAHDLGLKVILDIPINHCSIDFFAFKDVLSNQEASEFVDWFEIEKFPIAVVDNPAYSCWSGYKEYPQFNFQNRSVKDFFLEVSNYWITEFKIDGWRLDSSSEISYEFLKELISAAKCLNPHFMVIAENWHNDKEVIKIGADGITNYSLYWDVFEPFFIKACTVMQLANRIMAYFFLDPIRLQHHCWNFLSNHDVPRFFSLLQDKRDYPLALSLLFCFPGAPVIYYGEEINMEGLNDPANRGSMNWDGVAGLKSVLTTQWIKRLIHARKMYKDYFMYGTLSIPYVNEVSRSIVILREWNKKQIAFVFNFSSSDRLIVELRFIKDRPYKIVDFVGEVSQEGSLLKLSKKSNVILFLE